MDQITLGKNTGMNQPCTKIQKTTKLKCSLKQKLKTEIWITLIDYFFSLTSAFFFLILSLLALLEQKSTRGKYMHIITKTIKLNLNLVNYEFNYELLSRHTLETQIHIQTQIQKNFILSLATNDFLWLLLKYRLELPATNLLKKKQVSKLQKFVIFLIIQGVSPT